MAQDLDAEGTLNVLPMATVALNMSAITINVAMLLANTEYSYELPKWTKKYSIKMRSPLTQFKLNIGKVAWLSGTTYINVPENCNQYEENLNTDKGTTLFFQSPTASQVAEIVIWY